MKIKRIIVTAIAGIVMLGTAGCTEGESGGDIDFGDFGIGSGDSSNSETAETPTDIGEAPTGDALTALETIAVAEDDGALKYDRKELYGTWMISPVAGGECDTRQEAYKRDMVDIVWEDDCVVASAVLEEDPYTGEQVIYEKGRGSDVDIDHLVPLEDTCFQGLCDDADPDAQQDLREAIANDPYNILTVNSSSNRQKGGKSIDEWIDLANKGKEVKINDDVLCDYTAQVIGVKGKYGLSMTQGEYESIESILSDAQCEGTEVPVDSGTW